MIFNETWYLLKEKRDLIHTIKTILQIFPEGVLIRSLDPISLRVITKFANQAIQKQIWDFGDMHSQEEENDQGTQNDQKISKKDYPHIELKKEVQISVSNSNKEGDDSSTFTLNEFLVNQEQKFENNIAEDEDTLQTEQAIDIIKPKEESEECKDLLENETESVSFNVKTIKVTWDKVKQSYLHVFINTTEVKKLAKVKAINKWQEIMFASVSHEFRTPINAFSNALSMIKFNFNKVREVLEKCPEIGDKIQPLLPGIDKMIKIGDVSSQLLLNLVEDILDLAKCTSNTLNLNLEPFVLSNLLKEIDYIFRFQLTERRLDFEIIIDKHLASKRFTSDEKKIKQVLINLISNSSKFTQRGGISVKIDTISLNNSHLLRFKVRDTGIGIKHADISKLFNLFSRLDGTQKINQSGTGIGLSISKKLVESLGGTIKVRSQEGQWTEFIFTIKIGKISD